MVRGKIDTLRARDLKNKLSLTIIVFHSINKKLVIEIRLQYTELRSKITFKKIINGFDWKYYFNINLTIQVKL